MSGGARVHEDPATIHKHAIFVTLCGVDIPLDVLRLILTAHGYNVDLANGFGLCNADACLAVRTTWDQTFISGGRPVPNLVLHNARIATVYLILGEPPGPGFDPVSPFGYTEPYRHMRIGDQWVYYPRTLHRAAAIGCTKMHPPEMKASDGAADLFGLGNKLEHLSIDTCTRAGYKYFYRGLSSHTGLSGLRQLVFNMSCGRRGTPLRTLVYREFNLLIASAHCEMKPLATFAPNLRRVCGVPLTLCRGLSSLVSLDIHMLDKIEDTDLLLKYIKILRTLVSEGHLRELTVSLTQNEGPRGIEFIPQLYGLLREVAGTTGRRVSHLCIIASSSSPLGYLDPSKEIQLPPADAFVRITRVLPAEWVFTDETKLVLPDPAHMAPGGQSLVITGFATLRQLQAGGAIAGIRRLCLTGITYISINGVPDLQRERRRRLGASLMPLVQEWLQNPAVHDELTLICPRRDIVFHLGAQRPDGRRRLIFHVKDTWTMDSIGWGDVPHVYRRSIPYRSYLLRETETAERCVMKDLLLCALRVLSERGDVYTLHIEVSDAPRMPRWNMICLYERMFLGNLTDADGRLRRVNLREKPTSRLGGVWYSQYSHRLAPHEGGHTDVGKRDGILWVGNDNRGAPLRRQWTYQAQEEEE